MSILDQNMNKWLLDKIRDPTIENIYSKSLLPTIYSGIHDMKIFTKYYSNQDIDIKNSDFIADLVVYMIKNSPSEMDDNLHILANVLEIYGEESSILLPPNSNQSHTNYLFKKLIDKSENMIYNIPLISKTGKIKYKSFPMINVLFKNNFYKFCYKYSDSKHHYIN